MNVPNQPREMRLIAYVDDNKALHRRDNLGASAFEDIYVNAPDDAHKAIAEVDNQFWLIDLLKTMQTPKENSPLGLELYVGIDGFVAFPTEDAAIMAAMME